jgi:hypothetical protein
MKLKAGVQPRMDTDGHGFQAAAKTGGSPAGKGIAGFKIRVYPCSSVVKYFFIRIQLRTIR